MQIALTAEQTTARAAFRSFVDAEIVPRAAQIDQEERTPPELIQALAERGYLGAALPERHGGSGMDQITFGLLNEELARGCSSLRSLITVQGMVAHAIQRWGSAQHKQEQLPRMAAGQCIGAFALSEPEVGSDARHVQTTATPHGSGYLLNGRKKWMTYGQIADFFLVFAQVEQQPTAFLVEARQPGVTVTPIRGLLGTRGSMVAAVEFNDCLVDAAQIVGRIGFGFSHVAATALDFGRYSVAWGCVGISQGCLEASLRYTSERRQGGALLKEHQLIRQMITNMLVNVEAARLLCYQAGYLKETSDPRAIQATMIAKYFASTAAATIANDAVQIHGANGCSSDYAVQRYLRDAKIMEIIEGSTQIQQITIAGYGYQDALH